MEEKDSLPDMSFFLASSVHDMKNSLSLLSNRMEHFLGELTPDSFPGYEDLSQMLYETKRVNHNLIQLLALYKVGNHLYPFDPQPFLLNDFVHEMEAQCRPLLASRLIELETSCPDDLIWYFDEELVNGVIGQAINNASQYTRDRIRLSAAQVGDMLEIRVEDNGAGYPASMLQAIESEQRGISFGSGSTGLGLYFGRTVAAMHRNKGLHGRLRLENGGCYGGGCCILQLP
ncbi:Histidine kinase-, DNA gyrase B-, and HSP90-like ATPase [Formivibrio citricus]|uniref:Histidine kinase-, DNA gyrase B-, and HSP90-like ATPase n=1 Tax=Formivibrio citricus TaxID=83765 RepID=A0A1I5A4C0_9NEIS|nr:HAMP domain-containing sensor histidine kinase [Formivibrio citricus]SFN57334.1 Histidine kinase-, DNA gyrase B-, and HSP90-like ATPase [Formivibrio citricus]